MPSSSTGVAWNDVRAGESERQRNRRAASARLRVVERVVATRKSDGSTVED